MINSVSNTLYNHYVARSSNTNTTVKETQNLATNAAGSNVVTLEGFTIEGSFTDQEQQDFRKIYQKAGINTPLTDRDGHLRPDPFKTRLALDKYFAKKSGQPIPTLGSDYIKSLTSEIKQYGNNFGIDDGLLGIACNYFA